MPGTNMVVVEHVLRAAQAVRQVRPRIAAYVLMGLAVSGWMGFLVLAGVLLATRAAVSPGPGPLPESPIVKGGERDTNHKVVVKVQPAREPAPPPTSESSLYELGRYEERRRVQERMRHADAADYEDGNVSTARNLYDYAAAKGWAQAALALALTYDPNELQRRGVTVAGDPMLARLKACFDPWWPFPKLTPAQIDIFRSVIHPEVVIRASETDLAVLDLRQERNARALGDGHRIVYGVAGSGKTVLLIARAKLLAEDPEKRILILCYNRLLAQHLAVALAGHHQVTVTTFHRWGVDFSEGEEDGTFGEHLLARLRGDAGLRGRYDAVLIDEAQDWPCSWFQCARLALKEPETGDLMIVGDGSQSLYRKRDFSWADAGIHASGRMINRKFDLDRNYRNTAEILHAARTFSVPPGSGMQGVLALPVEPDTAIRSGPEPWLIRLDDATSEMHYAAALIETWLRGGLEIGGRRQRVKPGDIAVLYPRRRPDAAATALCDRLNGFTRAVLPAGDKPTGTLRDQAVKILPMHSARGLQFRIVLLLWADLLPSPFKNRDDGIDRGLLYVAMTRAEDMLVILHSGSSSYVEELYRALGTVPP